MLRPVLTIAAVGAVGFVVWKALWLLVLPLLAGLVGLVVMFAKVGLFALVVYAIWRLFFKKTQTVHATD